MLDIKNIKITPEMLAQIAELDEFKGTWTGYKQLRPEQLKTLKKVATIESIGSSNRIEGNKLSDAEVEEFLSHIDKKSFKSRDEEEVAGYAELMNIIFDNYSVIPLSENYIKQLHQILLKYVSKDKRHRGEYKKLYYKIATILNDDTKLSRNQRAILKLFDRKPEWTSVEISAELDINIETTKKSLQVLIAYGYLAKQGATKGAWYERTKAV